MQETLHEKHARLIRERDQSYMKACGEVDEVAREIVKESHQEGLRRSPKWAAMTENQRNYCHFMGIDPDEPGVPCD